MIVIQAPDQDTVVKGFPRVFLAGCANTDWRKYFVKSFDDEVVFYDPKRDNWDKMNNTELTQQIIWEYQKLDRSDIVVFHFNEGSVCPITLLEYGMWGLRGDNQIAVYVSDDYEKKYDVILQTGLGRTGVHVLNSEYDLIDRTKLLIMQWWYDHDNN